MVVSAIEGGSWEAAQLIKQHCFTVEHNETGGWVKAIGTLCRLYLKGQHYVLWLRETRRHAEDTASKEKQSNKTTEEKSFETGMHIHT